MNTEMNTPMNCPACRSGTLQAAERSRTFRPHGQRIDVTLHTMVCSHCGAEITRAAQHRDNLRALAARKPHYGDLLMGEEILELRKRYGLTQQQASKIFGKGKIAFSRYENEATYPDDSTTKLLALAIAKPDTLKWLADAAGVEIPLWRERCEDEQRVKLRALFQTSAPRASSLHRSQVVPRVAHRSWDAALWATPGPVRHVHLQMSASNDDEALMEAQGS